MKVKRYGWVRDLPDQRDLYFSAPRGAKLPAEVDLRAKMPPIYNQGELGSCVANAVGAAVEYDQEVEHPANVFQPSRLFIYYNARALEGTTSSDSGCQMRDGVKTVVHQGTCPEKEWPYDIAEFAVKPPAKCYTDATKEKVLAYVRVLQQLSLMRSCLAGSGPFVIGISVYDSFESEQTTKTGIVPMPAPDENLLGGHAILIAGYNDTTQMFTFRNSWGTGWGAKGYGFIPYAYLSSSALAGDAWALSKVE